MKKQINVVGAAFVEMDVLWGSHGSKIDQVKNFTNTK